MWSVGLTVQGALRRKRFIERAVTILMKYPDITHRIGALDELIANADRNIGNLLVREGGFEVIDHGLILGGSNWEPVTLPPTYDRAVDNKVLMVLGSEAEKLPFKSGLMAAYDKLVSDLPRAVEDLCNELNGLIDSDELEAIKAYLIARSTSYDMPKKMGMMI